ncbi:MAG TPA: hypothetical protein VJB08_02790 [Candidatus Nanoarchaeia archaeon]|nr:hypothetical protein [Candidatus Nanoarchaeia archaeon]
MEDTMFVSIEDPIAIRRTLLQGSKEIITALQRYEAFQYTQEMKIREVFILKNLMVEISKLGKSLEDALPVHHIRKNVDTKRAELKKKIDDQPRARRPQMPRPKPVSELDRLEEELNAIESKLGILT